MKKTILIFCLWLFSCAIYGQQQVMFTQYMFNGLAINPAYAGIHEGLSGSILWREQWAGFEGAPSTQTLSLHSPIGQSSASYGALIIRDKIGVTEQIGAQGAAAYRIFINEEARLSFGLQASMTNFRANYIDSTTGSDPTLANSNVNEIKPNFGLGLLYHSDKYYLGFSIPQMLNQSFDQTSESSEAQLVRHYFITGGIVIDLNPDFKLKPNLLLKYVAGAPIQVDLNLNLLIKEIVWVGLSYRSFESIDFLMQLQLTPKLQLGYAYDLSTSSELRSVNSGSHEIMLNYVFQLTKTRAVSPRYF
ncbi:PorP/SprF family type IX secretion system membrane protein [Reichenbachiella sp.]